MSHDAQSFTQMRPDSRVTVWGLLKRKLTLISHVWSIDASCQICLKFLTLIVINSLQWICGNQWDTERRHVWILKCLHMKWKTIILLHSYQWDILRISFYSQSLRLWKMSTLQTRHTIFIWSNFYFLELNNIQQIYSIHQTKFILFHKYHKLLNMKRSSNLYYFFNLLLYFTQDLKK